MFDSLWEYARVAPSGTQLRKLGSTPDYILQRVLLAGPESGCVKLGSSNGRASGLHPESGSSILSPSTKTKLHSVEKSWSKIRNRVEQGIAIGSPPALVV